MESIRDKNPSFDTTEKLPPQNVEAEQSVLGSLMIDKNAVIKIADMIHPEDFYKNIHGKFLL